MAGAFKEGTVDSLPVLMPKALTELFFLFLLLGKNLQ